jgi:archaellum biogenesis protein FlaJ (TadC family)
MKLSLKERTAQHQIKRNNKLNYFITNLENVTSCTITNESDMFYIISPSNRYQGYYQLTTFIRNEPYSHTQEPTIMELIKNNIGELLNYTIKEVI